MMQKSLPISLAIILLTAFSASGAEDTYQIIDNINGEVRQINTQLAAGSATALQADCSKWSACEFFMVFKDKNSHTRKIIDWVEGDRVNLGQSVTLRSIWEWYYDVNENPIFIKGTYEGEGEAKSIQQHTAYFHEGKVIEKHMAENIIGPFQSEAGGRPTDDDVGLARSIFQTVNKKLADEGR